MEVPPPTAIMAMTSLAVMWGSPVTIASSRLTLGAVSEGGYPNNAPPSVKVNKNKELGPRHKPARRLITKFTPYERCLHAVRG